MKIFNIFLLFFLSKFSRGMNILPSGHSRMKNCKLRPMHVPLQHLRRHIQKIIGVKSNAIEVIGPENLIVGDSINLRSCLMTKRLLFLKFSFIIFVGDAEQAHFLEKMF